MFLVPKPSGNPGYVLTAVIIIINIMVFVTVVIIIINIMVLVVVIIIGSKSPRFLDKVGAGKGRQK